MAQHGRNAEPIDNPSVSKVLYGGECQYLTTRGHCDCGTVLSSDDETAENLEKKLTKEIASMKRKGWSEMKISRAIENRSKADARRSNSGPDSIELWSDVLCDLQEKLKLPYAGLFVRLYSGVVTSETFNASRRQVSKNAEWASALISLKEDEVTVFQFT